MGQMDIIVGMLSEKRAGAKLKRISMKHNLHQENHSLITFTFDGGENEEHCIGIYGEDLQVSFGREYLG